MPSTLTSITISKSSDTFTQQDFSFDFTPSFRFLPQLQVSENFTVQLSENRKKK